MMSQQKTMLEMATQIKDLCCQIKEQSSSSAADARKALAAAAVAADGGCGPATRTKRKVFLYHVVPQLCPNCNKVVKHKAEDCFELEKNKENRPARWKLAKK